MKTKRILLSCHGPIAVSSHYTSPWEDVWITFKTRPNHRERYGPCLVSRYALASDLDISRRVAAKYPDSDEAVAELEEIDRLLRTQRVVINRRGDSRIPNIYTTAEYIDRAEAESMLTEFLARQCGITNPKFVWKRPDLVITPV